MAFKRTIEDFTCEHCGAHVQGNGYTNHCPKCLWSKHVDIFPGDRAENCGGMMEPIRVEGSASNYRAIQRCTVCGKEGKVGTSKKDDPEAIIRTAQNLQ